MDSALRLLGLVGLTAFTLLGASQALSADIDLTGDAEEVFSLNFDLGGGLTVTVTGFAHAEGPRADAPFAPLNKRGLFQTQKGLGVYGGLGDGTQLDGLAPADLMRFTFSRPVQLRSVLFEDAFGADEFDMAVDQMDVDVAGLLGTERLAQLPDGGFGEGSALADFADHGLVGKVFDFYTADQDDDYNIRRLTVIEVADARE